MRVFLGLRNMADDHPLARPTSENLWDCDLPADGIVGIVDFLGTNASDPGDHLGYDVTGGVRTRSVMFQFGGPFTGLRRPGGGLY